MQTKATLARALGWAAAIVLMVSAWGHEGEAGEAAHHQRPMHVLLALPQDSILYNAEAAALIHDGVPEKYGTDEWTAIVLTHEFHQHVGIYTLLGAKMGVRAREILDAPMRAVHVVSETGTQQPLACTIDGLQVGLGSTLGQNLITVETPETPSVAARFEFEGRTVRLSLKPEYVERVRQIIEDARTAHGNLTPEYFHAVEDASYDVWREFDRAEVFAVEELDEVA